MLTGSLEYPAALMMRGRSAHQAGYGTFRHELHELRQLAIAHNPETALLGPCSAGVTVAGPVDPDLATTRWTRTATCSTRPEPAILDAGACDLAAEYMATGKHLGLPTRFSPARRRARTVHAHRARGAPRDLEKPPGRRHRAQPQGH